MRKSVLAVAAFLVMCSDASATCMSNAEHMCRRYFSPNGMRYIEYDRHVRPLRGDDRGMRPWARKSQHREFWGSPEWHRW